MYFDIINNLIYKHVHCLQIINIQYEAGEIKILDIKI